MEKNTHSISGFEDKLKSTLKNRRSYTLFSTPQVLRRIEEHPICTIKNISETALDVVVFIYYADAYYLCPKTRLHVSCKIAGNSERTFTRAELDSPYNGPGVVLSIASVHVGDDLSINDLCDVLGQHYEINERSIKRVHLCDTSMDAFIMDLNL